MVTLAGFEVTSLYFGKAGRGLIMRVASSGSVCLFLKQQQSFSTKVTLPKATTFG